MIKGKLLPAAIMTLLIVSCSTPKQISYFQDMSSVDGRKIAGTKEITVRPKDKISIIVNCKSPELTALFNLPYVTQRLGDSNGGAISSGFSQGYISGYTVDDRGYIDFPVLGEISVAGMTRDEIASEIKRELREQGQATDAVVTVDFMNLYYQVLGEVAKPGRYAIDKDAVTILDAIGAAGDLTIYGRRDRVKVLRDENGKVRTYEVDLCSASDLLSSPVYYVRQRHHLRGPERRARPPVHGERQQRALDLVLDLADFARGLDHQHDRGHRHEERLRQMMPWGRQ